jgi:hypothetical protein
MPKYKLSELNLAVHPKGEGIVRVNKLGFVEFDYPNPIALIVGFHFGLVRASRRNPSLSDYHEAVFEIYEKNPKKYGGTWNAKLFIKVLGDLENPSFQAKIEPRGHLSNWTQTGLNDM